ncbi:hypothetical protein CDIK_1402 [Cucumispora dikerogammari]|nr:hypothetical protein CDIK_1402 [Cucumispora dikerogammari]
MSMIAQDYCNSSFQNSSLTDYNSEGNRTDGGEALYVKPEHVIFDVVHIEEEGSQKWETAEHWLRKDINSVKRLRFQINFPATQKNLTTPPKVKVPVLLIPLFKINGSYDGFSRAFFEGVVNFNEIYRLEGGSVKGINYSFKSSNENGPVNFVKLDGEDIFSEENNLVKGKSAYFIFYDEEKQTYILYAGALIHTQTMDGQNKKLKAFYDNYLLGRKDVASSEGPVFEISLNISMLLHTLWIYSNIPNTSGDVVSELSLSKMFKAVENNTLIVRLIQKDTDKGFKVQKYIDGDLLKTEYINMKMPCKTTDGIEINKQFFNEA